MVWDTHARVGCPCACACRAYAAIGSMGLGSEEHSQLRYLLHAVGLRAMQAGDAGARVRARGAAAACAGSAVARACMRVCGRDVCIKLRCRPAV